MSRFDWRLADAEDLSKRFQGLPGQEAWSEFVGKLLSRVTREDLKSHESYRELHDDFGTFVRALDKLQPSINECCVFVSHKSCDVDKAARIAWIAAKEGWDYWLDVEDPNLITVNKTPIPSPLREFLVAAIVEIALLNASHLIAAHTPKSHTSMWIPYEIGRAKGRGIWSSQVSGWFQPGKDEVDPKAGEYTYLMEQLRSRAGIERWLRSQPVNKPGCCKRPTTKKKGSENEPACLPCEGGTNGQGGSA